mmetsp:Transcript_26368/g.40457  ORF Transcript_26368/g.40457 Transcript_26368/m.40457 type:complete len:255 (-) Transcript_26368:31-795(-)
MTKEERREKYTQIARNRRDKKYEREKQSHLTCFKCRKRGHIASQCPEFANHPQSQLDKTCITRSICYKCGSYDHGLSSCPRVPKGTTRQDWNSLSLPYASCFVCGQKGHLASQCTQNTNGIYVNGGECRICGSNQHRATDCPENENGNANKKKNTSKPDINDNVNVEDLLEPEPEPKPSRPSSSSSKKEKNSQKNKQEQHRATSTSDATAKAVVPPSTTASTKKSTPSTVSPDASPTPPCSRTAPKRRRKVVTF